MKENLKVKLEKLPQSRVKLLVEVGFAEVKRIFETIFSQAAETVELPGFRKGKAPRRLVIEAVGETRLVNQTVTEALNKSLSEVLKEKELRPVSPPKIQINQNPSLFEEQPSRSLIYEAEFDVLPEIKLGDYKKIKVASPKEKELEVTDEEIEKTLEYLRIQSSNLKEVDRPAGEDDRLEIDFQATERGVPLEKLTSKNHPLILGKKTILPEIEEKLVGMKKDEEKKFSIVLPKEDRFQELKGKKVDFKVKLNLVQEVNLSTLDDEFAHRFGQKSLADLKKSIKEQIGLQKKQSFRQKQEQDLANGLISETRAELPEGLVLNEKDKLKQNLIGFLQERKTTLQDYLNSIKSSEQKLDEGLLAQAKRNLLVGLALGEIAKIEKILVNEKDGIKKVVDWLIKKNRT